MCSWGWVRSGRLRAARLASSPPAAARGGSPRALPCLGQFGPQKSVRELSARAGVRRGAGWARPTPSPTRPATPDLPRAPHRARRPPYSVPRSSRTRSVLSLSLWSAAGRAGGRAPETPPGLRLGKRAVRARLRPSRHVLRPRQQRPLPLAPSGLEQRLPAAGEGAAGPGEGRGGGLPAARGGEGGYRGVASPPRAHLQPSAFGVPQTPSVLQPATIIMRGHVSECLLGARPCAEGFRNIVIIFLPFQQS